MFDKRLLALLGKDKKYVVGIVVCNLLTTVCNVVFALAICRVLNALITGQGSFAPGFAAAFAAMLARFVLSLFAGNFQARLGTNAKSMLRSRIYEKVARLGVREAGGLSLASLTQVGVEGVEQLDLYYSTYIPQFFYSVISPFLLFALFMCICIPSAIVLLCCVPLIPMSIIAVSRYAKKIFAKYWGQYTKMGDAFLDNISGMKELKIFAADRMYHEKMNGEAEEFRKITMKVLTMQLCSTTIMDLVAYAGAGLGIAIAASNNASIHPLFQMSIPAALLFIVLSAVDFFLPLRALGSAFHVSMNGATAGRKILALLDAPEPKWGEEKMDGCEISLSHVSFSYAPERPILKDICLTVSKGELVGIVGSSGSGKSTLMSLIAGTRDVSSGEIKIGSKPLKSLSREDFYRHLGLVSYDTYLFNATVRENFRLAKEDITDEEIVSWLHKMKLEDILSPDSLIQEGASNLSGGQRQRLALAVHLSADRDIYLLDEVTSNIDAASEEIILGLIGTLRKEKTILMVSHRLRNFENADRVYVLQGGTIAEEGTNEELISRGGIYCSLLEKQKALEEGYLK